MLYRWDDARREAFVIYDATEVADKVAEAVAAGDTYVPLVLEAASEVTNEISQQTASEFAKAFFSRVKDEDSASAAALRVEAWLAQYAADLFGRLVQTEVDGGSIFLMFEGKLKKNDMQRVARASGVRRVEPVISHGQRSPDGRWYSDVSVLRVQSQQQGTDEPGEVAESAGTRRLEPKLVKAVKSVWPHLSATEAQSRVRRGRTKGGGYAIPMRRKKERREDLDELCGTCNAIQGVTAEVVDLASGHSAVRVNQGADKGGVDELTTSGAVSGFTSSFLGGVGNNSPGTRQRYKAVDSRLFPIDRVKAKSSRRRTQYATVSGTGKLREADDGEGGEQGPLENGKQPPPKPAPKAEPEPEPDPKEKAREYVNSIRLPALKEYAQARLKYLIGDRKEPPDPNEYEVSKLDAQTVRIELGHLGFTETGINPTPTKSSPDQPPPEEEPPPPDDGGPEEVPPPDGNRLDRNGQTPPEREPAESATDQLLTAVSRDATVVCYRPGTGVVADEGEQPDDVVLYRSGPDEPAVESSDGAYVITAGGVWWTGSGWTDTLSEAARYPKQGKAEKELSRSALRRSVEKGEAKFNPRYDVAGELDSMDDIGENAVMETLEELYDNLTPDQITEASLSRVLRQAWDSNFAVLSARRGEKTDAENAVARKAMASDIRSTGHGYSRVVGRWTETDYETDEPVTKVEPSFFVTGVDGDDLNQLLRIAQKYDQEAIIFGGTLSDGRTGVFELAVPSGKVNAQFGSKTTVKAVADAFTAVVKGSQWGKADTGRASDVKGLDKPKVVFEGLRYQPEGLATALGWRADLAAAKGGE